MKINPTEKQMAFLLLDCREAFYGGSAGGGKSYALLAASLQFVDVPQYNALILRDSFANLSKPEGLIDVSHQWLSNTDAKWKESTKTWLFPSGATLSFGHLDGPKSHYQYLSAAYQFVGIDEVVAIPEHQALYLFSRQRRTKGMMNVPIRFRCASNPPGREQLETGAWVKERYVDPRTRKPGAIFIPAKMDDNYYLDTDEYRIALSNLDPVTRRQLEDGDWDVSAKGRLFDRAWFVNTMVDIPPDKVLKRIRFWDLAASEPTKKQKDPDYTVGVKMSITSSGIYYIENIIRFRKSPAMTEATIRQQAELDGRQVEIYIEQESGATGKLAIDHFQRNVLRGFSVRGDNIRGKKAAALDRVAPVSSAAEAGLIYMVRGNWNSDFFEELEIFPNGVHDDQTVGFVGAFSKLSISGFTPRLGFF